MKVWINQEIGQIHNNARKYKGYLKIGKARFSYEITLLTDDQVQKLGLKCGEGLIQDDRQAFQICLNKKGTDIELTDEEYFIFYAILLSLFKAFHKTPAIFRTNFNMALYNLHDEEQMASQGIRAPIVYRRSVQYEFSSSFCHILNGPKFDCSLC